MKHDKEVQKAIDERFGYLYKSGKTLRDYERYSKSSYNEWAQADHAHLKNENLKANPDLLSEESTTFKPRINDYKKRYNLVIQNLGILTKKEKKVLEYLAAGNTMKETGKKLGYTVSAIESFLNKIRKKYDGIKTSLSDTIDRDEEKV